MPVDRCKHKAWKNHPAIRVKMKVSVRAVSPCRISVASLVHLLDFIALSRRDLCSPKLLFARFRSRKHHYILSHDNLLLFLFRVFAPSTRTNKDTDIEAFCTTPYTKEDNLHERSSSLYIRHLIEVLALSTNLPVSPRNHAHNTPPRPSPRSFPCRSTVGQHTIVQHTALSDHQHASQQDLSRQCDNQLHNL